MVDAKIQALRSLPAVSALLDHPDVQQETVFVGNAAAARIVRDVLSEARTSILDGHYERGRDLTERVVATIRALSNESPARVINGTGVIIQTNLGRAPVSRDTATAMARSAGRYVALETDLATGERGGRGWRITEQMRMLTGAERTLVVNNNAAAVYLMLTALCRGGDVLVSRGEAVEIGGGFRIPDVLRESGANLIEVGTTNRTYVSDYERAITDNTVAILKVHASNFAIVGFTATPALAELAALAKSRGVFLLEDAGSGCLLDSQQFGLEHEPTLEESLRAGVDVVCASGDKLLGGPQAGMIVGNERLVDRIARHPMARAVRADKTCLAGTAATLRHYLAGDATDHVPVWWAISRKSSWLEQRCQTWTHHLGGLAEIIPTRAVVGGGSLPGASLESHGIALQSSVSAETLARQLRTAQTAVVPRIIDDRVVVDARTVLADEDEVLLQTLSAVLAAAD